MPAARYWRVVGLEAYGGGDLELSALHLYEGSGEANYASVSTLLHGDGVNGVTSIVDNAPSPKTFTAAGNAQISTAQSRFGGSSLRFDGSGDYFQTPSNADFAFPGDFTIEFWAWKSANGGSGYDTVCTTDTSNGSAVNGWFIELSSVRGFLLAYAGGSVVTFNTNPNDSAWHHWAVCRQGSTIRLFLDGSIVSSATYSSTILANGPFGVGGSSVSPQYVFNGFIDDLRITKGVARYTANFSNPTSAFPNGVSGTAARVDATATISSSLPPISGAVANLQDGDTSTIVRFNPKPSGFAVQWDFGSGLTGDVASVRLGSSVLPSEFLSVCDLQYSTDAQTWSLQSNLGQFIWPGANTLTGIPAETQVRGVRGAGPMLNPDPFWREDIVGDVEAKPTTVADPARDIYHAGRGRIVATVKEDGTPDDTPVRRKVRLFRDRDGLMVRETWSNATTGQYSFTEIDENETYSVVSYDHNDNFRAVIADRITPTVA